jgi:hypothetical protein
MSPSNSLLHGAEIPKSRGISKARLSPDYPIPHFSLDQASVYRLLGQAHFSRLPPYKHLLFPQWPLLPTSFPLSYPKPFDHAQLREKRYRDLHFFLLLSLFFLCYAINAVEFDVMHERGYGARLDFSPEARVMLGKDSPAGRMFELTEARDGGLDGEFESAIAACLARYW